MTEPRALELASTYAGKSVLVTGHTGFKGAWLTMWLSALGAKVSGLALPPPTDPSLFQDLELAEQCDHTEGDIRDLSTVSAAVLRSAPDVVFHLAAQAIVREGHRRPLETFETNVIGTANVLEAVRRAGRVCAVVVVTSDKCYAPDGDTPRREDDRLGGVDPYSASKAAAEILVASYRRSFFSPEDLPDHGVAVATARAGNVIGGGDWATDRIVPDAMRALGEGRPVRVRNPGHVRPWQHVLEPLGGYLLLGMRLAGVDRTGYCEAWNFGPRAGDGYTVGELVSKVIRLWGGGRWEGAEAGSHVPETAALQLDISKASSRLEWRPRWDLDTTLARTVDWYRARQGGARPDELHALSLKQIDAYMSTT